MKTAEEIQTKITELEEEVDGLEEEFEEALEDEDIDEMSDEGEELRADFDFRQEGAKKQIKVLKWVVGE